MTLKTGVYDIASLQAAVNQTAVAIGYDTIAAIIAEDNRNFSATVNDMLNDLCATTADRQRKVGGSLGGNAVELDEKGQAPTQKDVPAYLVGFPLRRVGFAVGFTDQWLKYATGADIATRNGQAQGAHMRRMRYFIQKAIFTPTNATFVDRLVDNASLSVKALINADSTAIPNGPNGETFDGSTHTHYDGTASLAAANVTALIQDVVEHRNGAKVRVYCNVADVATLQGLTGFVALTAPYIIPGTSSDHAGGNLNIGQLDNRQIGWFGAAEVWTKPWVPANYLVAADVAAPEKPLVKRVEPNDRGMFLAAQFNQYPLHAEHTEWFYGFGVWNRLAMAVLKFDNATYSAPTLTY
jgi:hypothetical protein